MANGVLIKVLLTSQLITLPYPNVRREEWFARSYHGVDLPDPYEWMEDLESEETMRYTMEQRNLTLTFLNNVQGGKEMKKAFEAYFLENYNLDLPIAHIDRGSRVFYQEKDLHGNGVWYVQDGSQGKPEVLLEAGIVSQTSSGMDVSVSPDGNVVAYKVSKKGSDWQSIHFRNVNGKKEYPSFEVLDFTKGNLPISWSGDSKGIFFSRFPLENGNPTPFNSRIEYHRLGTSPREDILVAAFPTQPTWILSAQVSDDENYVIIEAANSTLENSVFVAKLSDTPVQNLRIVPIFVAELKSLHKYAFNSGSQFYFRTSFQANNHHLVSVNVDEMIVDHLNGTVKDYYPFEVEIPEHPHKVLETARRLSNDSFLLVYNENGQSSVDISSKPEKGLGNDNLTYHTLSSIPLPEARHVNKVWRSPVNGSFEWLFSYDSIISPETVGRCRVANDSEIFCYIPESSKGKILTDKFSVKTVHYLSYDHTYVPMYLVHSKNFTLDGNAPTIIMANEARGMIQTKAFDLTNLFFIEHFGGVIAVAHVRGGHGDNGREWTEGGSGLNQQHTYDDFIAAAEYLINNQYTNPKKLAAFGSFGAGTMVAASINQAPYVFGAAIINAAAGFLWCRHLGCSDNKDDFDNLRRISPLHNVRMPTVGQYPSVLVITDRDDDVVVPVHSYKYAAELQFAVGREGRQTNPLLLQVGLHERNYGETADLHIDLFTFCMQTLDWKFNPANLAQVPSATKSSDSSDGRNRVAWIMGITISVIAIFAFLVAIAWMWFRRNQPATQRLVTDPSPTKIMSFARLAKILERS